MNPILKSALEYRHKRGWSVIPVGDDKRPLIAWAKYQQQYASEEEIKGWWQQYPKANVAVVTGELSNLTVIDIDSDEGKDNIRNILGKNIHCPMVSTPRGGLHLYYQYHEGLRNNASLIPGTDLRAQGGYVVAPPSVLQGGKKYSWKLKYDQIYPVPKAYLDAVEKRRPSGAPSPTIITAPGAIPDGGLFIEGRRDEDLFHVANQLIKSGIEHYYIQDILLRLARTCIPPFPEKEALIKVKSAMERAIRQDESTAQSVDDIIRLSDGAWVTAREMYDVLCVKNSEAKKKILNRLDYLTRNGVIEKHRTRSSTFRMIQKKLEQQLWWEFNADPLALKLPLELEQWIEIYPSNTVIIAGLSHWGKSTFLIWVALLNLDKFEFIYLNSEMDNPELRKRFIRMGLDNNPMFKDKVKFFNRGSNFQDVIEPKAINFVDYISLSEEHYRMRGIIEEIDDKLDGGVAFISLQKPPGRDFGLGGYGTMERARVYLSLDKGKLKVVKAKNTKKLNVNGLTMNYHIDDNYEFISLSDWYMDEEKKETKKRYS